MPPRPPLRARNHLLPMGDRTYVMAILNLTGNSFSGDGAGDDVDAALRRAAQAAADGADLIDVGGESARADVPVRDPRDEADTVAAVIRRIVAEVDIMVSVDTYKRTVAEAAVQAGACMINDIGGFTLDTGTAEVAAATGAALVINYTFAPPKVRPASPLRYADVVAAHLAFFRDRIATAEAAGVPRDSIVLDPGIAFGKSHDEDLEVLRRLPDLTAPGLPVMVAASRKHFIASVMEAAPADRDAATVAVTALSIAAGADVVRVHDVRANVQGARIADAIVRARRGAFAATAESWPWASGATPLPGTRIGQV